MATDIPKNLFIRELAARHRVILLGGMAMIAHGLTRQTKDFDIWLEPFSGAQEWAAMLLATTRIFAEAKLWSLAQRPVFARHPGRVADEESGGVTEPPLVPSFLSSSLGTHLAAKLRFDDARHALPLSAGTCVEQRVRLALGVNPRRSDADEAGASVTGCVSKLELGHEGTGTRDFHLETRR
jgi:hypothetical protein